MRPDDPQVLAAQWIAEAEHCFALTGAGVSVGSGIPDFRSDSGLWQRFPPQHYGTVDAFVSDPDRVWEMFRVVGEMLANATPNAAHQALARWERSKRLKGVVTQNIDGLHQAAGSRQVLDFHGNATRLHCLGCGAQYSMWRRAKAIRNAQTPRCRCGNALKPMVILFGERLSCGGVEQAREWMRQADLLLVIGTSAEVAPASELPVLARGHGAKVIEFNLTPTSIGERVASLFVPGPAEETLAAIDALLP